jgi:predicted enzyme related to lactoylglutathione lyase
MVASSLAWATSPVHAATEQGSFVVLSSDAASVDATIASVEAAGGTVSRVNRAIGLVTATADAGSFASAAMASSPFLLLGPA